MSANRPKAPESCVLCGCEVHRSGEYGTTTVFGRSHASSHHTVPERFFGRTRSKKRAAREPLPLDGNIREAESRVVVFCYECHEELIHNPILLREDLDAFRQLIRTRGLDEPRKSDSRDKHARRISLFHEIIRAGIESLRANNGMEERTHTPPNDA